MPEIAKQSYTAATVTRGIVSVACDDGYNLSSGTNAICVWDVTAQIGTFDASLSGISCDGMK